MGALSVKTDWTSWSSIPAAFGRELCSLRPTLLVSFVSEVVMDSLGALHFPKVGGFVLLLRHSQLRNDYLVRF